MKLLLLLILIKLGHGWDISEVLTDHGKILSWKDYVAVLEKIHMLEMMEKKGETKSLSSVGLDYFDIKFESQPEAASVHSLRPHDIDVVAALGDSITAGTGIDAKRFAGILVQNRGLSWSVGGDEELETSVTVSNILERFNPAIGGYSLGNKLDFDLVPQDWFNVAVPGARAKDMEAQARNLIDRMKDDNRTSFNNDWKLISIFIGINDLCSIDTDPIGSSPEVYVKEIQKALDIMHTEIPRAMIQVIQILEMYLLPQVSSGYGAYPLCNLTQPAACGYVINAAKNEESLNELREINWRYQSLLENLIDSGRYDTRDDFTVVIQPFFKNTVLPLTEDGQVDSTYYSLDCFHFSSKGHALGAINIWNNMLQPVGQKSTELKLEDLSCPTKEQPHIFTRKNSPIIEDVPPSTCPTLKCKTTPDWAIGVTCTLGALAVLEVLLLIFSLESPKKNQKKRNNSVQSRL